MGNQIIAFDFDGVICDGLAEYFHSAWLAYQDLWQPQQTLNREPIRTQFYRLRPIIETGWEMVVLIEALLQKIPEATISEHWQQIIQSILADANLTPSQVIEALDHVRDHQITTQLDHWLNLHQFYDGILETLQTLLAAPEIAVYIITTKEARFTDQLLTHQGIFFPREQIFGKEIKQPKTVTLQQLSQSQPEQLWFIEDRLKTLENIQREPSLKTVKLFLADWGYNTAEERARAATQRINVVNLSTWQQHVKDLLFTKFD